MHWVHRKSIKYYNSALLKKNYREHEYEVLNYQRNDTANLACIQLHADRLKNDIRQDGMK